MSLIDTLNYFIQDQEGHLQCLEWDIREETNQEEPQLDWYCEESMRKIADEYDLVLSEDFAKEVNKLNAEIWDLKAKISRLENPENPQYTDEEMDAMTFQEWGHLIPGSYAAVQNGCKCPVLDNEEMPDDKKWVNGDCPLHGKKNED